MITDSMMELMVARGEAQAKSGKKEHTQGHLKKKMLDLQRQTKQIAKDTKRLVVYNRAMITSYT